jgi:phage FluMu gp28-like protein
VFIDNLYKTIGSDLAAAEEFIAWCATFAENNNMNITMTVSENAENVSENVKKYL